MTVRPSSVEPLSATTSSQSSPWQAPARLSMKPPSTLALLKVTTATRTNPVRSGMGPLRVGPAGDAPGRAGAAEDQEGHGRAHGEGEGVEGDKADQADGDRGGQALAQLAPALVPGRTPPARAAGGRDPDHEQPEQGGQ